MCQETVLCGLVSTLPVGIAVLVDNDICVDTPVTEVNVITRSHTAQYRQIEAHATASSQVSTDKTPQKTNQSDQVDENDEIIADLSPLFDESSTDFPPPLVAVDRSELIRLEQSDPDLSALFDLMNPVNKAEQVRVSL